MNENEVEAIQIELAIRVLDSLLRNFNNSAREKIMHGLDWCYHCGDHYNADGICDYCQNDE